ncbi:MAG: superoxide dismutase family protein [Desulfuromonadales bacterium]|nr:superoxide dismutase family protein [Desulfuromonadales bacterium]
MNKLSITLITLIALVTLPLAACQEREVPQVQPQASTPAVQTQPAPATGNAGGTEIAPQQAIARLAPTQGNETTGTVTFTRQADGVEVVAEIQGLPPGGRHGFHVHETGDCSAPDATSAGGHFNPQGTPHGAPDNPLDQRHAGDLGNIEAGPDGTAQYRRVDPGLQLDGPQSIVGKAVLVHANPDDFTSQPAGEAGARLACGVIEVEQGQ